MLTIVIFYGSLIFFAIGTLLRIISFLGTPVHLRWEIYREDPVYRPWKADDQNPGGNRKLKNIALDIFFLRGYLRQRARFWVPLYIFHIGTFLLILWHVWIFASASTGIRINPAYVLMFGHIATAMAFSGGIGILAQRTFDQRMRRYYAPYHYGKWLLILALLAQGFLTVYGHFGNSIPEVTGYVEQQLTFNWAYKINPPPETALHVLMASAIIIFLPFGHLVRLFSRYYHELRWDFVSNVNGSPIQRRVYKYLNRPVSWSAGHIGAGRNWTEVVAGNYKSDATKKVGEDDR